MKLMRKIFKIVRVLEQHKQLRLYEITDLTNINKSTTHRILSELRKENYVQFDRDNRKYSLGLRFIEICNSLMEDLSLINASKEVIDDLNNRTKETIHLVLMIGNKAVYIDKRESKNTIRMSSSIGAEVPFYCTAVGKAIIANMPVEKRNDLLDEIQFVSHTDNTLKNKAQLKKEIEMIKRVGYAIDNEENEENIVCIAAPIKDFSKKIVGAISITMTLYSQNFNTPEAYKDIIINAAMKISYNLGYVESVKESSLIEK